MNPRRLAVPLLLAAAFVASEAQAVVGMPLTPMSYAGVARRTTRRMAYAGAASGAYAAPVSTLPAGCVAGAPCGGTTYQPAYSGPNVVYVER